MLVKRRIRSSVKNGQTLAGADIDSDHNILVTNFCTTLKKIVRFQMRRPQWDLQEICIQKKKNAGYSRRETRCNGCDSGIVEVKWNNIKNMC
jgi:hypothetical protein